ncbi:MAG: type II toxin-antitoxin system PemK/MazF family toxin [Candidatus Vogelbacteria bacterium]|nr:type II toxin-antitoxin system PemK/MazF family toxin [Candidatus Vogelbacteria bacterium]
MQKDFDDWNKLKKIVNDKEVEDVFFREREIWWINFGLNVGYELDGKNEDFSRPGVIFRKFNQDTFWVLPLTTKGKDNCYHFSFLLPDGTKNSVNLSQLRLVDAKRLIVKLGYISEEDYESLQKKISEIVNRKAV